MPRDRRPPPTPAPPEALADLNRRLDALDFNLTTLFVRADDYFVMQVERELANAGLFDTEQEVK